MIPLSLLTSMEKLLPEESTGIKTKKLLRASEPPCETLPSDEASDDVDEHGEDGGVEEEGNQAVHEGEAAHVG